MKSLSITFILIIILILYFLIKNFIFCTENYSDKNNSLVAIQNFTKQAIRGEKGDLGLHLLEKNGTLSLGGYDDGKAGQDKDQEVQLLLGGKHNAGVNNGRKGHTTYKLRIDGYDNDGSVVYPIYLTDENKNVDFFIRNRSSGGGKPLMQFAGDLQIGGNLKVGNDSVVNHLMPKGTIVAYNGNRNIPYGWRICNGQYGTPDLRGRFILGESSSKRFNSRGGEERVRLTINQMPRHNHNMDNRGNHIHTGNTSGNGNHRHGIATRQDDWNVSGGSGPSYGADNGYYRVRHNSEYGGNHSHSFRTSNAGAHVHRIHYSGNSHSHNNMPPYYVLVYIMKII